MKINIRKKVLGMVIVPIIFICIVVGIVSANIIRQNITDEIELQLKTGAYSVGQTLLLCSSQEEVNTDIINLCEYTGIDVTVFSAEAIRIASTIENAVGTKMDDKILENIKQGNDYFATNANVNGEEYFGYYIPYFTEDNFTGATFTGIPQKDANDTIMHSIIKIIGCILLCGIIAIVVALILVAKIVKSINSLQVTIGTLLGNDLSVKHNKFKVAHDEIEEISNKTVDFSEHLNQIIVKIKEASGNLKSIASDLNKHVEFTNDTCNQISQAVESVAGGAVSQAEETTLAAENISEMSNELEKIKNNTRELHDIANSMDNAKNAAMNTLDELQKVNGIMASEVNSTSNQVNATNESVEQIKLAVAMIQDIADQTSLLSLNASIEAARAGEHGKGFAVVAEEIGKLANQSAESSHEIGEILNELVKNYNIIINNVESTSDNMDIQNAKLSETQKVFDRLENDIDGTVNRINDINSMIQHLDEEIEKMVDMISGLSAISEENSASTEETMAAIEELTATVNQVFEKSKEVDMSANDLMDEVNIFKTL